MCHKSFRLGMLALVLALSAGAAAQTSGPSPANASAQDNASPQYNPLAPRDASPQTNARPSCSARSAWRGGHPAADPEERGQDGRPARPAACGSAEPARSNASRLAERASAGDGYGIEVALSTKNVGIAPERMPPFQIAFTFICFPMYSAWRIARVTMVSVGFSAAPVVNWLPSETNRFLMSWL